MNIKALLQVAGKRLKHISTTPQLDAELLLAYSLKISRSDLFAIPEQELTEEQLQAIEPLLLQRTQGVPIAYLIGYKEFWSLELRVTRDTLIPRPETELLVEQALKKFSLNDQIDVVDLGTGSGAIALALATERSCWKIVATEKSRAALSVAKHNAQCLKITNIEFCLGDWCKALPNQQFHMIVSNPPYINVSDQLQGEIQFEPRAALVAEQGGLADIKAIAVQAREYLVPAGWLLLEHGYEQGMAAKNILTAAGYTNIEAFHDLAGHARVVAGQLKPELA